MSVLKVGSMVRGAVLGFPVSHSLSPLLHQSIFSHLKVPLKYEAVEVPSGSLNSFLADNQNGFDYLSLTMPLKEEALSLSVDIDPLVKRIQSANTLIQREGNWALYSTDGLGFIKALEAAGHTKFDSVLVLGAGGTARAVVGALDNVAKKISVLGRTSTRSEVLQSAVLHSEFSYLRWSDTPDLSPYDLVVNTTPAGAADILANSVSSKFNSGSNAILFDVIYKPWPTVLASRWKDSGGTVLNGSEMLLYQGIAQVELALGLSLDYQDLAKVLRPILNSALK
jgi:shikimate dehydrogenase